MTSAIGRQFTDFVNDHLGEGRQHMAEAMKMLLFRAAPDLFDALDFYDDDIFLEPLLFSYFNAADPPVSLEQILFGYIPPEQRPERIRVHADDHGVVYLPNLGYFLTDCPNAPLDLVWDGQQGVASLQASGTEVGFGFEDILRIEGTPIEVYRHPHPLLSRFYVDDDGNPVATRHTPLQHLEHLEKAFRAIREVYPAYYDALLDTVRGIVVFSADGLNSFATVAAHGVAFLNVQSDADDEVFFIEDLLHQCGHVICATLTFRKQDYFAIDPDIPLGQLTRDPHEHRTLYVVFHGVFTETAMNQCLYRCHEAGMFTGRQEHELLGRLAFILLRYRMDLENISYPQVYTDKGLQLYRIFVRSFGEASEAIGHLVSGFDLSGQPYNFSYERFAALNPLPEPQPR